MRQMVARQGTLITAAWVVLRGTLQLVNSETGENVRECTKFGVVGEEVLDLVTYGVTRVRPTYAYSVKSTTLVDILIFSKECFEDVLEGLDEEEKDRVVQSVKSGLSAVASPQIQNEVGRWVGGCRAQRGKAECSASGPPLLFSCCFLLRLLSQPYPIFSSYQPPLKPKYFRHVTLPQTKIIFVMHSVPPSIVWAAHFKETRHFGAQSR